MALDTYRITFETVNQMRLKEFCSADPAYYSSITQTVPNSQIPDDAWYKVERVASDLADIRQQADQLREWDGADQHFVRNVTVEQMTRPAEWELI